MERKRPKDMGSKHWGRKYRHQSRIDRIVITLLWLTIIVLALTSILT
ncbi:hypothetical protein JCM3263A_07040 [Thermobifida fusca]|nr:MULTISPECIES: hypothetical protein [Thermobifida]MDD6793112.1 hypothetical protein [Thermobifida fusca]QOS57740.1 hypothetical protein IM867_09790 [Thermobifida fusca]